MTCRRRSTAAILFACLQAAAAARAADEPCPRCGWHNGVGQASPSGVPPAQQQSLISGVHSGPEHEDKQLSLKLRVTTASAPSNAHQSGSRHTTADAAAQCSTGSWGQVQEQLLHATSNHDGDSKAASVANALGPAATQPQQVVTTQGSSEAASAAARTALQREIDRAAAAGQAAEAAATAKLSALQDAIWRLGSKSDLQQVAPCTCTATTHTMTHIASGCLSMLGIYLNRQVISKPRTCCGCTSEVHHIPAHAGGSSASHGECQPASVRGPLAHCSRCCSWYHRHSCRGQQSCSSASQRATSRRSCCA